MNFKYIFTAVILVVVLVAGFLIYQHGFKSSQKGGALDQLSQATSTIKETSSKDETANWQVFINRDIGFKIRYPKNWEISEKVENNLESLIKKEYHLKIFYQRGNTSQTDYPQVTLKYFVGEDNDQLLDNQLYIMMENSSMIIEAVKVDGVVGFKGREYEKTKQGELFTVSQIFPDKKGEGVFWISGFSESRADDRQVNLIISSFKFLD